MNSVDMHIVDRKLDLLRKELAQAMNQMAEAMIGITEAHRAFQIYVDENLQELRGVAGLKQSDTVLPGTTVIPGTNEEGKGL